MILLLHKTSLQPVANTEILLLFTYAALLDKYYYCYDLWRILKAHKQQQHKWQGYPFLGYKAIAHAPSVRFKIRPTMIWMSYVGSGSKRLGANKSFHDSSDYKNDNRKKKWFVQQTKLKQISMN